MQQMRPRLQFLKFAAVGAIGTALHYAILIVVVTRFGGDPASGAMAGAVCGAACNYFLNHSFTFGSDRPHIEALPRFLLMAGLGVLLNGVIVKALTLASINYLISQVAATLLIFIINFFLSKTWIFKPKL